MYNGIGLPTPRGSGTNGYVQRNLAFINNFKEKHVYKTEDDVKKADAAFFKEPNKEILEHERKRKIEVKCFELEQEMEEQGNYRKKLLEEFNAPIETKRFMGIDLVVNPNKNQQRLIPKGTHETAAVNILKNSIFKQALGIGEEFKDGNSIEMMNQRKKEETEAKNLAEASKDMKPLDSSDEDVDQSEKIKRKHHKKKQKKQKRSNSPKPSESDSEMSESEIRPPKHKSSKKSKKSKHSKEKRHHS